MASTVKRSGQENPNPQGKGMVPVLRDLGALQPVAGGPKSPEEFLRDYCVSSLVLAAEFRFKPVVGKTYFLYAAGEGWSLSMIAPHEWRDDRSGTFLAECRLRPDMTWDMDLSSLQEDAAVLEKARDYIQAFVENLSGQESIRGHLPFYVSGLPYYQRLLATALAASLEKSLPATGDDMRALIKARGTLLLS